MFSDLGTIGAGRHVSGHGGRQLLDSAASLEAGLPDVGGTNRVHRLGTRNSGTLIVNMTGAGNLTDSGGTTDVRIGSMANLGPLGALGVGSRSFPGPEHLHRHHHHRSRQFADASDVANSLTAGGLGALTAGTSSTAVHAYGVLRAEGTDGTFVNSTDTGNAYTNIILHPGSELRFQDTNATGAAANRWHDSAAIALNGSMLTLQTPNAAVTGSDKQSVPSRLTRGSRLQTLTRALPSLP